MKAIHLVLMLNSSVLILFFIYSWMMRLPSAPLHNQLISVNCQIKSTVSNYSKTIKSLMNKEKPLGFLNTTRETYRNCSAPNCITLAAVSCGTRSNETYTMIKTAILLTKSPLFIELFTDANSTSFFKSMEAKWPESIKKRVKLHIHLANFPSSVNETEWHFFFKECATLRMFLPSLLKGIDSLIYADSDVLFLAPLDKYWIHFSKMNSSQMVAIVPEKEDPGDGYYRTLAKHPYYGKHGVNTGIMLMNLTRLRNPGWEEGVLRVKKDYHNVIKYGDQDIMNIIFSFHPEFVYVMNCTHNYRHQLCAFNNTCKSLYDMGAIAIHGDANRFHMDEKTPFQTIYNAWNKFDIGQDLRQDFYDPLIKYFKTNYSSSNCWPLWKYFTRNMEKQIIV